MSVTTGLQKKFGWGWAGGMSSIKFYFGFLDFFNFAKPLKMRSVLNRFASLSADNPSF